MKTKATTWAAQIVAVLLMLAAGTASASSGLLVGNSPLGKNTLEGGFHKGLASVSAEACRGCEEFCRFDAAGLFVAPIALTGEGMTNPAIMRSFFTGQNLAHTPANVGALRWYLQVARNTLARYGTMEQTPGVVAGTATQTQRIQQILQQLGRWGVGE